MVQKKVDNTNKDLSYYVTLFTLEGHSTWRADLDSKPDGFQRKWDSQQQGTKPKILKKNVLKIDRLTGQIIPLP